MKTKILSNITGGLVVLSLLASCNDKVENPLVERYSDQKTASLSANDKVLWIVMDGVSGSAVRQAVNTYKAPYTAKLIQNSYYSFNGLADSRSSVTVDRNTGWRNLLTGTTEEGGKNTIFNLAAQKGKTVSFHTSMSDGALQEISIPSELTTKYNDDAATVSAIHIALKSDDKMSDLTIVELSDVEKMLPDVDYMDEDGLYVADPIIAKVNEYDKYISRLTSAVNSRIDATGENWLVIVTSSYGGVESNEGTTVYDMKDRNTFCMVWNPEFSSVLKQRPVGTEGLNYNYATVAFSTTKKKATKAEVVDPKLFMFEFDINKKDQVQYKNYTVQFALWINPNIKANSGPSLLSKAQNKWPNSVNKGWDIAIQSTKLRSMICKNDMFTVSAFFREGNWHVITAVWDYSNLQYRFYVDGKPDMAIGNGSPRDYIDLNKSGFMETDSIHPLTIGYITSSDYYNNGTFYMTNLQIYDVALPADFIRKNYNRLELDKLGESYEYWDHLIGYWPNDRVEDAGGTVIKDYSKYGSVLGGENAGRSDFVLTPPYTWVEGTVNSANLMPSPDETYYQQVPNNIDIPYITFQWLGIPIDLSWNWNGICPAWPYKNLQ